MKKFNGEFFKSRAALPLGRAEIGELRQAASYTWKEVDPSIFGTLPEQALDPNERDRLGAHYTPRAWRAPSASRNLGVSARLIDWSRVVMGPQSTCPLAPMTGIFASSLAAGQAHSLTRVSAVAEV